MKISLLLSFSAISLVMPKWFLFHRQIILPPGTHIPDAYGSGSDEDQVRKGGILVLAHLVTLLFFVCFENGNFIDGTCFFFRVDFVDFCCAGFHPKLGSVLHLVL